MKKIKIIETDNEKLNFQSTAFLEPFTADVGSPIKNGMPALMYGTQLSEEGLKCAIPGFDYNKLYDIWSCPRIVMNVAVCTKLLFCVCFVLLKNKNKYSVQNIKYLSRSNDFKFISMTKTRKVFDWFQSSKTALYQNSASFKNFKCRHSKIFCNVAALSRYSYSYKYFT